MSPIAIWKRPGRLFFACSCLKMHAPLNLLNTRDWSPKFETWLNIMIGLAQAGLTTHGAPDAYYDI